MPTKTAKKKSRQAKRAGKKPTTQASPFVEEQVSRLKRGRGNAKSKRQAVAIGLSEARREGVKIGGPKKSSRSSARTTKKSSAGRKSAAKKK